MLFEILRFACFRVVGNKLNQTIFSPNGGESHGIDFHESHGMKSIPWDLLHTVDG